MSPVLFWIVDFHVFIALLSSECPCMARLSEIVLNEKSWIEGRILKTVNRYQSQFRTITSRHENQLSFQVLKEDMQSTYSVILKCVQVTIFAVENQ
jgi:hypothetical protein